MAAAERQAGLDLADLETYKAYKDIAQKHGLAELELPVLILRSRGEFVAYYKGGIVVLASRRGVEVRPCASRG